MNSLKATLLSLRRPTKVEDHDDPVLGRLTWDPVTERWVSGQLSGDRPFHFKFCRDGKAPTPPQDCVEIARSIAGNPGALEEQVRLQLSYATARRDAQIRAGVMSLQIDCVVFRIDAGKTSGEVLLRGDPAYTNWIVWHENGIPSLATQHWE